MDESVRLVAKLNLLMMTTGDAANGIDTLISEKTNERSNGRSAHIIRPSTYARGLPNEPA